MPGVATAGGDALRGDGGAPERLRPGRSLAGATLASTLAVAPVFLLGAMSPLVRADLGFNRAQLGSAVAAFWAANALAAVPGGRVAELIGPRAALLASVSLSAVALLGIAVAVHSWTSLLLMLCVAGAAYGIGGPAAGLAIARGVPVASQGVALGMRQAAPPLATMFAGIALPFVALTVGWRWGFAAACLIAPAVALVLPAGRAQNRPRRIRGVREGDASTGPLVVLSLATACGGMVASSLGAFYVESAVAGGLTERSAGLLLAAGAGLSVILRLASGRVADVRGTRVMPVVVSMLGIGSVGVTMIAIGSSDALLVTGTLLALGPGWSWNGLLALVVVRISPNAPGAASGIVLAGGAGGAVIGPLLFAFLIGSGSFAVAWVALAMASTTSAALVLVARSMLRRDLSRRSASTR